LAAATPGLETAPSGQAPRTRSTTPTRLLSVSSAHPARATADARSVAEALAGYEAVQEAKAIAGELRAFRATQNDRGQRPDARRLTTSKRAIVPGGVRRARPRPSPLRLAATPLGSATTVAPPNPPPASSAASPPIRPPHPLPSARPVPTNSHSWWTDKRGPVTASGPLLTRNVAPPRRVCKRNPAGPTQSYSGAPVPAGRSQHPVLFTTPSSRRIQSRLTSDGRG
jgi:hypothetical protein